MSIKFRIALLFSVLVTLLLAFVSMYVFFFSQRNRENVFEKRLRNRAYSTARVYSAIRNADLSVIRSMDQDAVASLSDKSVTIIGQDRGVKYMFADNPGDSLLLAQDVIEKVNQNKEHFFSYHGRRALVIRFNENGTDYFVGVAAYDADGHEYLQQLKQILVSGIGIAIILSVLAGFLFAKTIIHTISRITREIDLISINRFSQRIKVSNTKDELNQLANTINILLDRLQESFAIQRRFISNASHELSTPLTSISSQLEVALQKGRTTGEYQEVLQSVYEDIREMQVLTRSLLDIAKMGSQGSIDLQDIRFDEVLFKVVSDIQKHNISYKVKIQFEELPEDEKNLTIFGNTNLIYMALKNVIENGCKYAADNHSLVELKFENSYVQVKVVNHGDIISDADVLNIFHPFFRAGTTQHKPGFGLGLTLTKRILALHKGTIEVKSDLEAGTIFTIRIPSVKPS